ncbi:MAG: thiamine phosphate synthase [Elsteraceae bacterium]
MAEVGCRLYLISPPAIDLDPFAKLLTEALEGGDVACFQLRLPGADEATLSEAIARLAPIAQGRDVAFLVEARVDLALRHGCDGVHIAAEDGVAAARKSLGRDLILGVACGASAHAAMEAGEAGADYVSFGPFFDSANTGVQEKAEIEILRNWALTMTVPSVAVGGVRLDNCAPLVEAGADFLAVLGAVWTHPAGPKAAVAAFNAQIQAARPLAPA